mgnify:CR=1 FL=1
MSTPAMSTVGTSTAEAAADAWREPRVGASVTVRVPAEELEVSR